MRKEDLIRIPIALINLIMAFPDIKNLFTKAELAQIELANKSIVLAYNPNIGYWTDKLGHGYSITILPKTNYIQYCKINSTHLPGANGSGSIDRETFVDKVECMLFLTTEKL